MDINLLFVENAPIICGQINVKDVNSFIFIYVVINNNL